ncbi:MAG: F0F1 ATP synthase subunit A, partial [Gammaproteobacteria bacterium]|nr:F0F1 ATP synthase subunit A [Gammaproteobacteria bacterium]
MEDLQPGARILFTVGPVAIADSVAYTWLIMGLFWLVSWAVCGRLILMPGPVQVVFEGIVGACENAVKDLLPRDY